MDRFDSGMQKDTVVVLDVEGIEERLAVPVARILGML